MTIRPATAEDVPDIVRMARRFIEAPEYVGLLRPVPLHLEQIITTMVEPGEDKLAIVAEDWNGAIVGMLGLIMGAHPLSGERVAFEVAWWVNPEARGAAAGLALWRQAEQWAQARGAVALNMVAPNARTAHLYERRGYRFVESTYQRRWDDATAVPAE